MTLNLHIFKARSNANWNNTHLDSPLQISQQGFSANMAHLQDCIEHPTIGLLARREQRTNGYRDIFHKKIKMLNKFSLKFRSKTDAFKETFNKLYPKTGNARKFLINNDYIVLDRFKPIKKDSRRAIFKSLSKIF